MFIDTVIPTHTENPTKDIPLRKAGIELEEMASLHALIAAAVIFCLFFVHANSVKIPYHQNKPLTKKLIKGQKQSGKGQRRQYPC